jgi:hypothetical protein
MAAFLGLCGLCSVAGECPNSCSGHGRCKSDGPGTDYCECESGWVTREAPDCSLRSCPQGVAWWDFTTEVDTAHAMAECSNMGECDRTSGLCTCQSGFGGTACERLLCPLSSLGDCSGKGRCVTLRDAAALVDQERLFFANTYGLWDADKISGCVCEAGYKGYDCSKRECITTADTLGVSNTQEVQVLDCTCPSTCSGHFFVGYHGAYVKVFPGDSAVELARRLSALDTVASVDVSILPGGATVCDASGASSAITFRGMAGDLSDLDVRNLGTLSSSGGSATLAVRVSGAAGGAGFSSQDGVASRMECSGRGYCDSLGRCWCLSSTPGFGGTWGPSDGEGGFGTLMDCGNRVGSVPTRCPLGNSGSGPVECAGRGTCDLTTFKCACNDGYTGYNCIFLTCPRGRAWFDEPSADDTAHALAECSNMGLCNRDTGLCSCRAGFTGYACERLDCPANEYGTCSGHGSCYSMSQLALLSENNGELRQVTYGATPSAATWDAASIYGCYCDAGYYHGPFAWDFPSFQGSYNCLQRTCPFGDNPQTIGQSNDVQTIQCTATGGTFTVTFREVESMEIPYDASPDTLEAFLNQMYSIHHASVGYSGGSTQHACSAGGTLITVRIKVPGDLPMLKVDVSQLTAGSATVTELVQGTTEFIMCSGQGTCDAISGVCTCFPGYVSSDGSGDGVTPGQRGDCGAKYIFSLALEAKQEDA